MARLPILEYPDPRLRIRAEPVTKFDSELKHLVADLFETMYAAPGYRSRGDPGQRPQTNPCLRYRRRRQAALLPDQPRNHAAPRARLTPKKAAFPCRSSTTSSIARPSFAFARSIRTASPFELDAEGMLAVCIQHEMDHLEGKLFVDYLSELKRERLKKKASKKAKRARRHR